MRMRHVARPRGAWNRLAARDRVGDLVDDALALLGGALPIAGDLAGGLDRAGGVAREAAEDLGGGGGQVGFHTQGEGLGDVGVLALAVERGAAGPAPLPGRGVGGVLLRCTRCGVGRGTRRWIDDVLDVRHALRMQGGVVDRVQRAGHFAAQLLL